MNGQFQETPAIRLSIPEDRKQQIIVVLSRMIGHRLTETSSHEEHPMRKDREHSADEEARGSSPQKPFMLEGFRVPFALRSS
jgi:hypothetical protein